MTDAYDTLLIERHADGYAVVTLNRPEALNALNSALFRDLADRRGAAIVMVTHDNKVLDIADRIIHLEAGTLAAAPTPDPALRSHQVDGHERA